jgi:SNF2 family DNA or RNA helicase
VMKRHREITEKANLDQLRDDLHEMGISFECFPSAINAVHLDAPISVDSSLSHIVSKTGRAILSRRIPELHAFQVEGALFLSATQRALLLDEMGLGKTIQSIAAACLLQEVASVKSCLVVAPKSVLKNWQKEINRFSNETATIVEGTADQRRARYDSASLFKIVTLESLRRDFPRIGVHDLVVCDEVQKARNIDTLSNQVLRLVESRFFFGLSGTAIEKGLEDFHGILRIVRPEGLESTLEMRANHLICDGFGRVKATMHPEFFLIRHSGRVLRRKKCDTDLDLPQIATQWCELPLTSLQESMAEPLLTEMAEIKDRLKIRFDFNDFDRSRYLLNRIVELSNSTEMIDPTTNSSSKMEWLAQFLSEQSIDKREKVVIFTRWVRSQQIVLRLCRELGIRAVSLSGGDSGNARELAVREFTFDDEVRVFVSTDAGGVGVNLQVARIVVNLEPAWNPSTDSQRIQRVHRIGQNREVFAFLPVTPLDCIFTLSSHPKKSYPANAIDSAIRMRDVVMHQTWGELVAVIEHFQKMASGSW